MKPLALTLLLMLGLATTAAAQDGGWTINSFDAKYTINPDRSIGVIERLVVDFGSLERHGIFREINTEYRKVLRAGVDIGAGTERVDIDNVVVVDGSGRALSTDLTRGGQLRIRIGDADRTVTGVQTYVISYRIERGLGFFADHDELYWQVTGTEWPVPILSASASVHLATTTTTTNGWAAWCYAGWAESNANDRCTATVGMPGSWTFTSGRLEPGEGLTVVASFPKGIIAAPTAAELTKRKLGILWPVGVPFIVFGLMLGRWKSRGREPESGSVVPYWKAPADLRPGPAGTLWDQQSQMNDIVATILDLSVRGFIRISEVSPKSLLGDHSPDSFVGKLLSTLGLKQTDWELERVNQAGETALASYERLVLDGIFAGATTKKMSDLHNEFYTELPKIHAAFYQAVVDQGLFAHNPRTQRMRYIAAGMLIEAIGLAIGIALANALLVGATVVSGIIVMAFASSMPARTAKGARGWTQLRGLEEYIRRAEKLELEATQGPERTTNLFEALLPYAVALGVSDIWVKQFGPILAANPPTWYVGARPGTFNTQSFTTGLNGFQTAATRTLGSSPGSSSGGGGGGSVGGGGGGGGGGSW